MLHLTPTEMAQAITGLGMTLDEFLQAVGINRGQFENLAGTLPGQDFILSHVDRLAAQTITIGDFVNAMLDAGLETITVKAGWLHAYDGNGQAFSVKLSKGYAERQRTLKSMMEVYQ